MMPAKKQVFQKYIYALLQEKMDRILLNREPSQEIVEIWASALHTTPAYLLGETDDPSEGKKNNPATAQDARQRDIVVLTRMASQLPEEDYNRLVKNFEDTLDIYLRARGLDPDDYR